MPYAYISALCLMPTYLPYALCLHICGRRRRQLRRNSGHRSERRTARPLGSCAQALYICPHTAVYVSAYCAIGIGARGARRGRLHLAPRRSICGRMLLHMCPHTALYVSAYCSICVCMLFYRHRSERRTARPLASCAQALYMWPHAAIYVSAYCSVCVRILRYRHRSERRTARPLGSYAQALYMSALCLMPTYLP
jgi:ABC-type Fe3+ transport system permease subunit